MVVRVHNLRKWQRIAAGSMLVLSGAHARKIRLEVNSPGDCRADLIMGDKHVFLAAFRGMEVIEFTGEGDVSLMFSGPDEVWYFTADGQVISYDAAAQSFTKPMSRKSRNPDLERMMFKLEQNARRREAQQADEFRAMLAARGPHNPETGEVLDEVPLKPAPKPAKHTATAPDPSGAQPVTEDGDPEDEKPGA
jgi:hypothetical protein